MSHAFDQVLDLVDAFLVGGDFWELWGPIAGAEVNKLDYNALTSAERVSFDLIYDLVYMAQEGDVTEEERALGLLGESDLRDALGAWKRARGDA